MSAAPSLLDRDQLLDVAAHHFAHGWLPVPGAGGKRPALRSWSEWARLARRGERPAWAEIERTFDGCDGVGHIILAGGCVVDCDGEEGEKVLLAGPLPDAPEVTTRHGRHLYFSGPKRLPWSADLGPKIHLLGPGHYVELPPTSGKIWRRHYVGDPPALPRYLADTLRHKPPAMAAHVDADPGRELAAWRELLGELSGNGPWRAHCPLHLDDRPSFSVFRGQADGRLIGRCHAGCGTWTARRLRHRLGNRRTAQYTRAHESITALGDSIGDDVRDALRWVVGQAERHGLDLLDPDGIGASYRQLAAATQIEQVGDDGALSNRGRAVARLYDRLHALGVVVIKGQTYAAGGRGGRTTRLRLPEAWVSMAGDGNRGDVTLGDAGP